MRRKELGPRSDGRWWKRGIVATRLIRTKARERRTITYPMHFCFAPGMRGAVRPTSHAPSFSSLSSGAGRMGRFRPKPLPSLHFPRSYANAYAPVPRILPRRRKVHLHLIRLPFPGFLSPHPTWCICRRRVHLHRGGSRPCRTRRDVHSFVCVLRRRLWSADEKASRWRSGAWTDERGSGKDETGTRADVRRSGTEGKTRRWDRRRRSWRGRTPRRASNDRVADRWMCVVEPRVGRYLAWTLQKKQAHLQGKGKERKESVRDERSNQKTLNRPSHVTTPNGWADQTMTTQGGSLLQKGLV